MFFLVGFFGLGFLSWVFCTNPAKNPLKAGFFKLVFLWVFWVGFFGLDFLGCIFWVGFFVPTLDLVHLAGDSISTRTSTSRKPHLIRNKGLRL